MAELRWEDVQTIIKVFPELSFAYHLIQVPVCGRDNPCICLNHIERTESFKGLFLNDLEELSLQGQTHLRHFVKQYSAVIGELKFTLFLSQCARECTLLVTKELRLEQGFENSGAVDIHERSLPSAQAMQNFGHLVSCLSRSRRKA